jgi:hypothetical protein
VRTAANNHEPQRPLSQAAVAHGESLRGLAWVCEFLDIWNFTDKFTEIESEINSEQSRWAYGGKRNHQQSQFELIGYFRLKGAFTRDFYAKVNQEGR